MLSRVVFGVVLSGDVVRVVRSVRSGNRVAGGATLWGRYTKKKTFVTPHDTPALTLLVTAVR